MAPIPTSSVIVEDWFHGFYTAMVLLTIWTIFWNKDYRSRHRAQMLPIIIAMYICSTMHSSLNWVYFADAVDENETPNGPGLFTSLTHIKPWIEATGDTFFSINILLADALLIWRCWIIWHRRLIVVIIPIMATLSGLALTIASIYTLVGLELASEPFTAAKKTQAFLHYSTTYFSLSIATSLTTTFLITLRIILVQRASKKVGILPRNRYTSIIEILAESAALYSVTLLIFVILLITKNENVSYAQNIFAQIAGLAPMLIILRVATGQSRDDEDWSTRRAVSDLQFRSRSAAEGAAVSTTSIRTPSVADANEQEVMLSHSALGQQSSTVNFEKET